MPPSYGARRGSQASRNPFPRHAKHPTKGSVNNHKGSNHPKPTSNRGRNRYNPSRARKQDISGQSRSAKEVPPLTPSTSQALPAEATAKGTKIPGYVTVKEHEQVLDKNAKLSQELESRVKEADSAGKQVRDLSLWAYHERSRLTGSMSAFLSKTAQDLGVAVEQERSIMTTAIHSVIELEINKTRAEVGMAPLSKEESHIRLLAVKAAYDSASSF